MPYFLFYFTLMHSQHTQSLDPCEKTPSIKKRFLIPPSKTLSQKRLIFGETVI